MDILYLHMCYPSFNMHPTPKAVMSYRELKEIGIVTCGIQADLGI